ncbi:MAG: ABC transporter permease [Gaiellaceae bacterium]
MSVVVLLATLLRPDWIEIVLRVDPDHGSGSLEWLIVAVTAVAAITCSMLATIEWRRTQEAM